jgi:hypothetical protein
VKTGHAVLLTLAFAGAAGAQPPTPVYDVENPARTPFRETQTFTLSGDTVVYFEHGVLARQRLVTEFVSFDCKSREEVVGVTLWAVDSSVTKTGSAAPNVPYRLIVYHQGITLVGSGFATQWSGHYAASQALRIYADSGPLGVSAITTTVVSANCQVTVSGYLVSVP